MKLYHSVEELNEACQSDTLHIARRNGFDTIQEEDQKTLCGKHGSTEILEVYPDGSWQVLGKEISGSSFVDLKIMFTIGEDVYGEAISG